MLFKLSEIQLINTVTSKLRDSAGWVSMIDSGSTFIMQIVELPETTYANISIELTLLFETRP